jgi:glycosyltransferase involved in cell wall biosynthesis
MKVSVCVITYNHVKYIEKCILGIINQFLEFEFEVIVCDDCSSDGTSDICVSLKNKFPHIKYYRHDSNIGMMANFRFAVNQSTGDYISLCEGDDYWFDNYKLIKQYNFLENNTDFVVCGSFVSILNEFNQTLYTPNFKKTILKYSDFAINGCSGVYTCTMFFRSNQLLLDKINQEWFLDLDGADHFILLFLTSTGKNVFILSDITAVYRIHSKGIWSSKVISQKIVDSKTNQLIYLNNIKNDSKTKKYFYLSNLRLEYTRSSLKFLNSNYFFKKLRALIFKSKFYLNFLISKLYIR